MCQVRKIRFLVFTVLLKRLNKIGKTCKIILLWKSTIVNHLYFTAVHGEGDPDKNAAIWDSMRRHIADKHTHPNTLYERCDHGELAPRLWIAEGKK